MSRFRRRFLYAAMAAGGLTMSEIAQADFVAYNDMNSYNDGGTQPNANTTDWGWRASTYVALGNQPEGGALKDITSGNTLSATVAFNYANVQPNMSAGPGTAPGDAALFNSYVAHASAISYNSGMVGSVEGSSFINLTFSGLNPSSTYNFATYGTRGSASYAQSGGGRWTKVTINGADTFAWANSPTPGGTLGVNFTSYSPATYENGNYTYYNTGYNPEGYLVALSDIAPGNDGSFSILFENTGAIALSGINVNTGGWYAPGAFQLEEISAIPEPTTIGLLASALVSLVAWRRRHRCQQ